MQARTTGADGPICEQKHFTKVEDRPVTKEITTQIREHHPIEKVSLSPEQDRACNLLLPFIATLVQ